MTIENAFHKMFDNCPNTVSISGTQDVHWSRNGVGFGSFYFYTDDDGNIHCDSECMSREFVKEILCSLVDNAIFDDEEIIKKR